jgi:type II secretory pathway component GspD/PulD (secretin)
VKSKLCINLDRVIVSVVLGFIALASVPPAKAANVDYSSYEYELRHNTAASSINADEYADEMDDDLDINKTKDVATRVKEKTEALKAAGYFQDKPDAHKLKPELESKQDDGAKETMGIAADPDSDENEKVQIVGPVQENESGDWMVKPGDDKRNAPMDQLSRQLHIDKDLKAAKSIAVPTTSKAKAGAPAVQGFDSQTDAQIIDGLVKPESQKTKLDLNFNEASLGDVFMTLGKSGNINVMIDPLIKDLNIDINLKQVTFKEACILLAVSYNLGFKRIEGTLFITTKDKIRAQTIAYKVIKLRNVKALEVKAMVADLIRTVNVNEQINSLIVIGQPEEIAKVEGVVKAVDRAQPQVILEANIIEVNKDALRDLGIDWSDQISLSYQESGRPVEIPNVATSSESILNIGAFERSPLSFTAIIKMLENENKAKVLSNPRVTTMNEKEAEIFVGDRIPYTINTVSGGVATTEVRFEEPGIRLKITPMIIDGDFVVIKVEPEVSFIFSFRGPDNQYPWVKKRQATAYVRIRNNHPFVLGGLLTQEEKKNLYKVPLLGNVPWLGNLFSYERHSVTDTELIITITPTVVQGN